MPSASLAPGIVRPEAPLAAAIEAPELAIPDGWVIDDLARERLARQLAYAPDHITGVVAETSLLPAGASYRVHAERLCLQPRSLASETSQRAWPGAIVVRPGVSFEVRDGAVEVEEGRLLVDPGAHVHDPWRPIAPLEDASALGRPPFPRRPVVVFLACEPDVEALDWARSLVNNLVRRDVEGRLAMLDIAEGLHLTQQCRPSETSIRALSPDVIVALDQLALERALLWCDDNRSAVVVEYTPDVAATAELVSWQLERAQGRLRARIGRQLDAPSLVSLVNRLCSGPHPMPPSDTAVPSTATAVRAILKRKPAPISEPATRRSVVVVTGDGDMPGNHLLEGLVDHLVGAGHAATVCGIRGGNSRAVEADVAVIASPSNAADTSALIEARRLIGRPTIASIDPAHLVADARSATASLRLTAVPARLATSCGSATSGSTAVCAVLRTLRLRTHLLPPLLTREVVADLRLARGGRDRSPEPVIGWSVGAVNTPMPSYAEAVAEALVATRSERAGLRVEIVGDAAHVPARFRAHRWVRTLPARPAGEALCRWTAHLWSPPMFDHCVADNTLPLMEASAVGVPTVLPQPILTTAGGYPSPGLLIERFHREDAWADALRLILDDDTTASRQSRAAMRRFDTTHSPAAAEVAVNRFLGWALYKEEYA